MQTHIQIQIKGQSKAMVSMVSIASSITSVQSFVL